MVLSFEDDGQGRNTIDVHCQGDLIVCTKEMNMV